MSLLEGPEAQGLLEDATISGHAVRSCCRRLTDYLARYLPLFYRKEERELFRIAIEGRLSGLDRKTSEPIAREVNRPRRGLQRFVGAGNWDDEAATAELRRHVAEELSEPNAVLVLDPSAFPKKGTQSCGVQRQWCGRLGKTDNCQVGVFLAYASAKGHVLVDRRLYLPKTWAKDKKQRQKTHVPEGVKYQSKWKIGLELIAQSKSLPHAWVTGDDEFGRVAAFRAALGKRKERYVLDVPCNTLVRDLDEPVRRRGGRKPRKPPFRRVDAWLKRQPASRWQEIEIRDGEKGPLRAKAIRARVQTKMKNRLGMEETLVVIRTLEAEPRTYYTLSNADRDVPTTEIVLAHAGRHRIEESLQVAKSEVGLDHYEVRSWTGWHHHMTLCMLTLLFLALEKRRLGKKNTGHDGAPSARTLHGVVALPASDLPGNRTQGKRRATA